MALEAQIQDRYNKATEVYGQARAILDEYGDKALPQEKANEVDNLFAQFDGYEAEAKRFEAALKRERQNEEIKNTPARRGCFLTQNCYKLCLRLVR
mgnify:CR=1 FL=1